jgi:invasion protein IalB
MKHNTPFTRTLGLTIGAAALAAMTAVSAKTASAQEQPPTNGWFKVCSKQEDNDICNVQFRSVAPTGQLVTGISLATISGKINRKVFQVQVPHSRFIPAGVKVQVDDNKEVTVPYAFCFPQACMAEVTLDDGIVEMLKGGGAMTVTSTNFQNKANPVEITLAGFTAAYDGPALKQDELQERQRKLQEELQSKAEEQRKKLQEMQQKAKQTATDSTEPSVTESSEPTATE